MKKNISINISGIIFHIEEDGYDTLKNYLESINSYFSSFEDSSDIISDIENRIAELFLKKLSAQKQVITREDVDTLMATMGSIRDFQTVEEESAEEKTQSEKHQDSSSKRLLRDLNRKIVGGVSSGIAAYFTIDPLWIRLIFVILFLSGFYTDGAMIGVSLITYVIFWVVMPGTKSITEDSKIKKLFRNPDERVLGGVATGIASYFGTDKTIIRLIFVLTTFLYGTGLIAYIILWIITPEAKTITDKVEMKGEPVTLSNIESNLKRNLRVSDQENVWVKILLFPFRILSQVINWLSKVIGPFLNFAIDAVRIIAGIIFVLFAFTTIVANSILLFIGLHIMPAFPFISGNDIFINFDAFAVPEVILFSSYSFVTIPLVFLILIGLSIVRKRKIITNQIGWPLFSIWIISFGILSFTLPQFVKQYQSESKYITKESYEVDSKSLILDVASSAKKDDYKDVKFKIIQSEDSLFKTETAVYSRGSNWQEAQQNSKKAVYSIERTDSLFIFNDHLSISNEAYRFQHATVTIKIPENVPFIMSDEFRWLASDRFRYRYNNINNMDTLIFIRNQLYNKNKALAYMESDEYTRSQNDQQSLNTDGMISLEPFTQVTIVGPFDITLKQGANAGMWITGEKEAIDEMKWNNQNGNLKLIYKDNWTIDFDIPDNIKKLGDINLVIQSPDYRWLEAKGGVELRSKDLTLQSLHIEATGGVYGEFEGEFEDLELELIGASRLVFKGSGDVLNSRLVGASILKASELSVKEVDIKAVGASIGEVWATQFLNADASSASKIRYKGDPNVKIETGITGVVDKE